MPAPCGGARHADRLVGIVDGEGADEVGVGVAAIFDLPGVIVARASSTLIMHSRACSRRRAARCCRRSTSALRASYSSRSVAINAMLRRFDRRALGTSIAELRGPVGIGAPACAFQHETRAFLCAHRDVAHVVVAQARHAEPSLSDRSKLCELRQIDAVVENQRGLEPAVGQKQACPTSCGNLARYFGIGSPSNLGYDAGRNGARRADKRLMVQRGRGIFSS